MCHIFIKTNSHNHMSNLLMAKPPMERSVEAAAIGGEGAEVVVIAVVVVVVILVIAYGRELNFVWG